MEKQTQPLTESMFLILVSLIQPLHGYGIMQEIETMSEGRVKMGPGTLYGGINTLLDKKLIHPVTGNKSDRKKMYQITATGKNILELEYSRLKQLSKIYEQVLNR